MATEPDVTNLHQEIDQTRADLTQKLETLEEQVRDTIRSTTENVSETVEAVTSTVEETIEQVSSTVQETVDSVKKTFDMSYQMRERPWVMLGGSIVAGFLAGALLNRARENGQSQSFTTPRFRPPECRRRRRGSAGLAS
jgi:ElaB/YqjD/DUF883 family membrane-anchored ribosome-binding protein